MQYCYTISIPGRRPVPGKHSIDRQQINLIAHRDKRAAQRHMIVEEAVPVSDTVFALLSVQWQKK